MANAVFYHKIDSSYDDLPAEHYHFPAQYKSRVDQVIGDRIIYYGPDGSGNRGYWATALVLSVRPDSSRANHYYADIKSDEYVEFDKLVPYNDGRKFERKLFRTDGGVNGGRAIQAVRLIEPDEYSDIVAAGLSDWSPWPDRVDDASSNSEMGTNFGFAEEFQTDYERPILTRLVNKKYRDAKFKQHVRAIYDRTCAFTGLRLINGLGRPEVEAAHIRPVEENGPDSIRNGIALSGTVHWMFDRGLLSLEDDFTILKSRHLNHDVSHILRPEMKAIVPLDVRSQPHPYYLAWHRENRFKI